LKNYDHIELFGRFCSFLRKREGQGRKVYLKIQNDIMPSLGTILRVKTDICKTRNVCHLKPYRIKLSGKNFPRKQKKLYISDI